VIEFPLTQEAELVLEEVTGGDGSVVVERLLTSLKKQTVGLVADMLSRLDVTSSPVSIDRTELLAHANREAELYGDIFVRCEHLLLGWRRSLVDTDAGKGLEAGRSAFQVLRANRAFARYEELEPLTYTEDADRPAAILLAGMPGTGKSTLAEALARTLNAPVFSMDWQLGAFVPFGILRSDNMIPLSEVVRISAVARQLQLGMSAIIDATAHTQEERSRLRSLTDRLGGRFVGVECVCSDEQVQRSRLESRSRGIPGWPATVSWDHVEHMKELWEPWHEPHLVLDSAVDLPEANLRRLLGLIPGRG
jgi:predicted kinase